MADVPDRKRVVTAFIRRAGRVLLFRRSDVVATYRRRLAGVSGAVEEGEDPGAAAWRELEEETGWRAGELALVAAGLPVDVNDQIGKKAARFRVHPFLYDLGTAGEPRLCEEHTEWRWVEPDDVLMLAISKETVPELDEVLARVWDPPSALPPQYRAEARAIHLDLTSGAAELARRAAVLVLAGAPPERVAALRPTMAPVVNAARAAAHRARDVLAELAEAAVTAAAAVRRELAEGMRVATFSRSSTVAAALAGAPRLHILCARSLPGGEGERMAREAGEAGHEVELLDDDALRARVAAGEVDLVLVGADAVLADGAVVNKVGTAALASAAAAGGVPFVVAADAWKRWPDAVAPPMEPLFEVVPAKLIGRIVGA